VLLFDQTAIAQLKENDIALALSHGILIEKVFFGQVATDYFLLAAPLSGQRIQENPPGFTGGNSTLCDAEERAPHCAVFLRLRPGATKIYRCRDHGREVEPRGGTILQGCKLGTREICG
jgi:hypothetical protein